MENLAHLSFKSEETLGRFLAKEFDRDNSLYWMNPFGLDLIKIQYSKALRRLRGKTQVISGWKNIHIRDRMIHSMEVFAIATQIAYRLGANVSLVQAGAMSHDLGHVVFGHLGESFIKGRLGEDFRHERFVIFVLEMVERDSNGLNLSYETLQAIRNHSRGSGRMIATGSSLEDDIIMYSDKLSYIFSDYNDIKRMNLSELTVPSELNKLGSNQTERLYACARALCLESLEKGRISFEDSEEARCFNVVRDFMYEEVYHKLNRQHLKDTLARVYDFLYRYYQDDRLSALSIALMAEEGVVVIGEMLDKFSDTHIIEQMRDTTKFAVAEFLDKIPEWAELDFCNSDRFLDKNNFGKVPKIECFAR
jgi:dGTPase